MPAEASKPGKEKAAEADKSGDLSEDEVIVGDGKTESDPLAEKPLAPIQLLLGAVPSGGVAAFTPQPPPLPSAPKQEMISSAPLLDIAPSYLYDRTTWADFKKALTECGGSWNLPDWMTTIVRGGSEWTRMMATGVALDKYF